MMRKLIQGIVIGSLSAAFAIALWYGGWLVWLESASWDFRVRQMAKPGKFTSQICLVMLDQYSLDYAKEHYKQSWPWDRSAMRWAGQSPSPNNLPLPRRKHSDRPCS